MRWQQPWLTSARACRSKGWIVLAQGWGRAATLYTVLAVMALGLGFGGWFFPAHVRWTFLVITALAPLAVPPALARGAARSGGGIALLLLLAGNVTALVSAASIPMTVHGYLLWVTMAVLFCAGFWLAEAPQTVETVVVNGLAITAAATVVAGLLGWLGLLPVMVGGVRQVFAPFLDYRNTYAIFVAMGALAAAVVEREGRWPTWRWPVFLVCTWGLGLTGSRGAALVFVIALGGYVLSRWARLARILPQLLVLAATGMYAGEPLRSFVSARQPAPAGAWLMALGALGLGLFLAWVYDKAVASSGAGTWIRWANRGVAAATVLGLVWLVPRVVGFGRALLADPSNLGRWHHLVDGWQVLTRFPLGLGWDGWRTVYTAFQDYGYVISLLHSGVLEMAVAYGAFGLAAVAALTLALVARLWRLWRTDHWRPATHAWGWALAALLLHASFDMDLAEMMFMYFLWFSAGYVLGVGGDPAGLPPGRLRWAVAALTAVVVLATAGIITSDLIFHRGIRLAQAGDLDAAATQLRKAAALDPSNALARFNLAQVLTAQSQRGTATWDAVDALWQRALALEPYQSSWWTRYGDYHAFRGRPGVALVAYAEAVRLAPYRQEPWDALIPTQVKVAQWYLDNGRQAQAEAMLSTARATLADYQAHVERHFSVPVPTVPTLDPDSPAIRQAARALAE